MLPSSELMNCITKIHKKASDIKGSLFKDKLSQHKNTDNYAVAKELVKPPTKLMTNTVLREREKENSKLPLETSTDGRSRISVAYDIKQQLLSLLRKR